MAVPMVTCTVLTLLVPFMLERWQLLLSWSSIDFANRPATVTWSMPLLVGSGVLGVVTGLFIFSPNRSLSRPANLSQRFVQDLLAYDFYIDKLYNVTVVWAVAQLSRLMSWIDRFIVDGVVNLTGLATLFSGSALKYNVTGQTQFYVLTIVLGIGLTLVWFMTTGQWTTIVEFWSERLA